MSAPTFPYGFPSIWSRSSSPRCVNAEPGTFNHECSQPAQWIGTRTHPNPNKPALQASFCNACKISGAEARSYTAWARMPGT